MIRHWCEAMGDRNPVYTDSAVAARSVHGGVVAPPTMLQAWTMPGIAAAYDLGSLKDAQRELHALLSEHGYTGVVATDTRQTYARYLQPGDRISAVTLIESISEQKTTALGAGYFIETRTRFLDQRGEDVGSMTFRVLKFKPARQLRAAASDAATPAAPRRLRPPRAHDNGWWWEAIDRGELRIQRCSSCGTLRHPPRPMCHVCQSQAWDSVAASGRGTLHSYVIVHHPPIPGYEYPLAVGLVALEEGTRIVSNLVDCRRDEIQIGMLLECAIRRVDDELALPLFRPVGKDESRAGSRGPE
jgi:uncharacterized OB-fold protein/acyl dehydratase